MPPSLTGMLRSAARRAGIPNGAIRSDLPELFGIPSFIPPDLLAHWRRVLRRSRDLLTSLPAPDGPRVALVTPSAKGFNNAGYTAVMAYALRLRGADPFIVYCDAWLDGCEVPNSQVLSAEAFAEGGPRPLCDRCHRAGKDLYAAIGLPSYPLSGFIEVDALAAARRFADELPRDRYYDFAYKGMPLGPHVEATVARFSFTHTPPRRETDWAVALRLVRGAVMTAEAVLAMDRSLRPDVYVVHYGAYVARGTTMLAAKLLGKRAVVWSRGYGMEETLMFGEGENAFMELAERSEGPWRDLKLAPTQERQLDELLVDRATRNVAVKHLWDNGAGPRSEEDFSSLRLDPGRPVVTLYSNIGFDTKLWYDTPLYREGDSWVHDTIQLFASRPEHLVIRVHPDEAWLPGTNQRQTIDAINRRFPMLSAKLRIVPPESKLSSYELARISKAVLVFGSLIGLELAARGTTVIAAGRGPYWGKGFTYDVRSREGYESLIARLDEIAAPDPERTSAARRFAYYFYFLRNVPFVHWNHDFHAGLRLEPWWKAFRTLDDLRPGREANLDAICEHVLHGRVALARGKIEYVATAAR